MGHQHIAGIKHGNINQGNISVRSNFIGAKAHIKPVGSARSFYDIRSDKLSANISFSFQFARNKVYAGECKWWFGNVFYTRTGIRKLSADQIAVTVKLYFFTVTEDLYVSL